MSNRLTAFLALIVGAVILVYASVFVVDEREQANVVRFGEIKRTITEPGLYFKLPLSFAGADTIQYVEDRTLRLDLDDMRVQVADGKFYVVDAFMMYEVEDARRFREQVGGQLRLAEQRLQTQLDSALRRVYGERGFEAALSEERNEMMQEVRAQVIPTASVLGISVKDVRIRRTDLTDEVSQQTYERMQAERLAEAERLRARGRETAQRIRAVADRQVVEITADASRDAEILRGEGDADRTRIFAEALGQDIEFYEYRESLLRYAEGLPGSTLVLSPDSEFLRFLKGPSGSGDDNN
jgi:membrane protease subunit HflC